MTTTLSRRLRSLFWILAFVTVGSRGAVAQASTAVETAALPSLPHTFVQREVEGLTLAYPPGANARSEPLLKDFVDFRKKLTEDLGLPVLPTVHVRIAASPEDMASLAPIDAPPPAYAAGVAYPALHLILLTLRAPGPGEAVDLPEVFRHELAHLALHEAGRGDAIPRWFDEGFAVRESGESSLERLRTLWEATLSKTLLPLADLDHRFPEERFEVNIAYAQSADFVRFIMRGSDRHRFVTALARLRSGQTFDRALGDAYGTDLRKLEFEWRENLSARYGYLPLLTGSSLIWVALFVALSFGWMKRNARAKAILARWDREEAEAREASATVQGLMNLPEADPLDGATVQPIAPIPFVEHEGNWHTLH